MTTKSATYREPIEIQEKTTGTDVSGDPDANASWSTVFSPFARVEQAVSSSGEEVEDGLIQEDREVAFFIRYRSGVNTQQRVVWDGDNYDIRAVGDETGKKKELKIEAKLREAH